MARGSVYPYHGAWAVRYDAALREDGRRRQVFKSGFTSRQEAEVYLAQQLADVSRGVHVTPSRRTFGEFARYWLEVVIAGAVRPSSYARYADLVRLHLLPAFGTARLETLTPALIQRHYRRWDAAGLAPRTIRTLHALLGQILAAAVNDGLLAVSIMRRVTQPALEDAELRTWTEAELDRFLREVCPAAAQGVLWHVYAVTGMRRGEALGLRWRDVDWTGMQLLVRQQAYLRGDRVELVPPKTRTSRRAISIGAQTIRLLEEARREQLARRLRHGPAWHDLDLVFPHEPALRTSRSRPGDPQLPVLISRRFRALIAGTDLPPIRLHDLRHTHATLLLRHDGNVKAIAARLGHSPGMLLRVYAHAVPSDQERAVGRLEAALADARAVQDPAAREG